MSDRFEHIKSLYRSSYIQHGDTPSALLTPKGRNELRYRAVLPHLNRGGLSLLDFGCGLGYLLDYLNRVAPSVQYTGVDLTPEFVSACRQKFDPSAKFHHLDPHSPLSDQYDVVFASGVFNLKSHSDPLQSLDYAYSRIQQLFSACNEVLICDFMTSYVDFTQDEAQHFSPGAIADLCATRLTRRFMIRHDLLPYEFTLVAWKDDSIRRPDNAYEVDLLNT